MASEKKDDWVFKDDSKQKPGSDGLRDSRTPEERIIVTQKPCGKCGERYEERTIYFQRLLISLSGAYCDKCRLIVRAEEEAGKQAAILAGIAKQRRIFRQRCGIPKRFELETFETFKQLKGHGTNIAQMYTRCLEYANGFPLASSSEGYHSLVLVGKWGVGKTHLACSIAHRILDRFEGGHRSPVLYTSEPQLFRRIQATYNRNPDNPSQETEDQVFAQLCRVPLLIIDDVGKEERSDTRFVQRAYFSIINGRYDAVLPIVMTANLSPDGLADHLGNIKGNEASFDRLREMCSDTIYEVMGENYRDCLRAKRVGDD